MVKKYAGQVFKTEDNKVTITVLKSVGFDKCVWPDIDDINSLNRPWVIRILP